MSLPFFIAKRYLFSKKRTNLINVITGVSVFGLAFGTASLILIMSVFNGFEDLIMQLQNTLVPDVKIVPVTGKTFELDSSKLKQLESIEGIEAAAPVLEELALFQYNKRQEVGMLKGITEEYRKVVLIDSLLTNGDFLLKEKNIHYGILTYGIIIKLGVNLYDPLNPINIYLPRVGKSNALTRPFNNANIYPAASFQLQQDTEYQYILAPLSLVRRLVELQGQVSSVEIKLKNGYQFDQVAPLIINVFDQNIEVLDKEDQNRDLQKIIRLEKWMGYAILCLAILLVALNLIGTLWMIVLDKKTDISVLKSLGATDSLIKKIFLSEGVLITLFGLGLGLIIGLGIFTLQDQFGIIPIPEGYILDAYPMRLKGGDLIVTSITVLIIGLLAILPPALRAHQVQSQIRDD